MTFRVVVTSPGESRPLNRKVIDAVFAAAAKLGDSVKFIPMTPSYAVEPGALIGADMLLVIGALSDASHHLEHMPRMARRAGAISVFWSTGAPHPQNFSWLGDRFDHFMSHDLPHAAMRGGHANVHHLPLGGCFVQDYRPLRPLRARKIDMFFCGKSLQNRQIFIDDLRTAQKREGTAFRMQLAGPGWRTLGHHVIERTVLSAALQDICSKSRFVLYIHGAPHLANEPPRPALATPRPRLFETALAGTVQICDSMSSDVDPYFDHQGEICMAASGHSAHIVARNLTQSPEAWSRIARASQRRALRSHCYEHRLMELFRKVQPDHLPRHALADMRRNCAHVTARRLAMTGERALSA